MQTLISLAKALVAVGRAVASMATLAQTNPCQRGPAPDANTLGASRGPMAISQFTVCRPSGYRAGTGYCPTHTGGTVGASSRCC